MRVRPQRTRVVGFAVVLGLVLTAGGVQAADLQLGSTVTIAGSQTTVADEGAIQVRQKAPPENFRLEAGEIELDFRWKSGTKTDPGPPDPLVEVKEERGKRSHEFNNASLSIGGHEDPAGVLAYPGDGHPSIEVRGSGGHVFDRLDYPFLTRVGKSPGNTGTGNTDPLGFWYEAPSAWLAGRGSDRATVEGNFSLFLNNVTVTVRQGGQVAWENWTGYRETQQAPGVFSYKRHLAQLNITDGKLTVAEDDAVDVFGPQLTVTASGAVAAEAATGRLETDGSIFTFDGGPLRMEGRGRLNLSEPAGGPRNGPLSMTVGDSSRFEIGGGEAIEPNSALSTVSSIEEGPLWILAGLLIATAGVVNHRSRYVRGALQRWRTSRYTKWMTRGREVANAADFGQAATCFRRAARAQPDKGVAWYHLAISLLEDDRPREVLDVVDEAREGEAIIDELDFLEVEAEAARRLDDRERCRSAVRRLAEGSEAMASTLVRDLELGEDVLGEELADRLSPGGDDGGLPGYV